MRSLSLGRYHTNEELLLVGSWLIICCYPAKIILFSDDVQYYQNLVNAELHTRKIGSMYLRRQIEMFRLLGGFG